MIKCLYVLITHIYLQYIFVRYYNNFPCDFPHQINVSQGAGTIGPRSGLDLFFYYKRSSAFAHTGTPIASHWECDVGINVIAPGGGARPRSGTKEAVCENCVLVLLLLLLLLLSSLPPARDRPPFFCLSLSLSSSVPPQLQSASGVERSSAAGRREPLKTRKVRTEHSAAATQPSLSHMQSAVCAADTHHSVIT